MADIATDVSGHEEARQTIEIIDKNVVLKYRTVGKDDVFPVCILNISSNI